MKAREFYNELEKIIPLEISSQFCSRMNAYDNSGIIINLNNEINSCLFSLDFNKNTISEAMSLGSNLIVTHHPAIYNKINKIDSSEVLGSNIIEAIKNGISVYSMHLNADMCKNGIDTMLAGVFGEIIRVVDKENNYGRVVKVNKKTLDFVNEYKKVSESNNIMLFGDKEFIQTCAIFCGDGTSEDMLEDIKDVDLLISSDIKHHVTMHALQLGMSVMSISHYSGENIGFREIYKRVQEKLKGKMKFSYYVDKSLL